MLEHHVHAVTWRAVHARRGDIDAPMPAGGADAPGAGRLRADRNEGAQQLARRAPAGHRETAAGQLAPNLGAVAGQLLGRDDQAMRRPVRVAPRD